MMMPNRGRERNCMHRIGVIPGERSLIHVPEGRFRSHWLLHADERRGKNVDCRFFGALLSLTLQTPVSEVVIICVKA